MPRRRLILVRHGETVYNRSGRYQGHTDVPLSEEGRRQAVAVAERLAGLAVAAVWSSDLSRARETAETIARPHRLEVRVDPDLREMSFGAWEGLTREEIEARYGEDWRLYVEDATRHAPTGGETLAQLETRAAGALRRALADLEPPREEGERGRRRGALLLVSHGGTIKVIASHLMGWNLHQRYRLVLDNTSVSVLDVDPERPERSRLLRWNDTAHLGLGL
ncbi:MAG: histidine phosphatase family protein [Bacillota bacterium]|nr:histidine phosphatase family protein [Bacillota bacterium]